MLKLDKNYYLRKCYLEREQVPTQSVMRKKMGNPLADVYFKSMIWKLKILAGLEPPLQGGGNDWYQPPEEQLKGRAVLKPIEKKYLAKLGYKGIYDFGHIFLENHIRNMREEEELALHENNEYWKDLITRACAKQWEESSKRAADDNTRRILKSFHDFEKLYATSINKIEYVLMDASAKIIEETRDRLYENMKQRYEKLLKHQATMLYNEFEKKYNDKMNELKGNFILTLENRRSDLAQAVHDMNVDKHIAIEKLRHLIECQNLACQIYVALKEREECQKILTETTQAHRKIVKRLDHEIDIKNLEIHLEIEKAANRRKFNKIWQEKVCFVIKRFRQFVGYCLETVPEQREFFINLEKLLMLQMNDSIDNPDAESVIKAPTPSEYEPPKARSKPFVIVGDFGTKPQFDENLCPEKGYVTPPELPVIIINNRCIYTACDNIEKFSALMTEFLRGYRGDADDGDIDDRDHGFDVPFRDTASNQIMELNLQDSIMKILQKDIPNVTNVPLKCCCCNMPHCFCTALETPPELTEPQPQPPQVEEVPQKAYPSIKDRDVELRHAREPKMESYIDYVRSKICKCPKTAKKHLREHMPLYMRSMSKYDVVTIPNYEPCDLETMKEIIRRARGKPAKVKEPEKGIEMKSVTAQCSDLEFDYLCDCLSEDEILKLQRQLMKEKVMHDSKVKCDIIKGASVSNVVRTTSSFAMQRVYSLRRLLDTAPQMRVLFSKPECNVKENQYKFH